MKKKIFVTSAGDFLLHLGVAEQDGRVLDTKLGAWLLLSIVVPLPGVKCRNQLQNKEARYSLNSLFTCLIYLLFFRFYFHFSNRGAVYHSELTWR